MGECKYLLPQMKGIINIIGLIGSIRKDGKVVQRGVELADVISDVTTLQAAGVTELYFYINSKGGYMDVGKKIRAYIASLPNAYTVAENECASIATEIHLAVPKERRKAVKGINYLIHAPMYEFQRGVALNNDELQEMADDILDTEKEMASMYAKSTGMDKDAVQLLMKQETSLTEDQLITLGFVSEIIEREPVKAVALINKPEKENTMHKETKTALETMKETLAKIAKKVGLTDDEPNPTKKLLKIVCKYIALDLTTKDGVNVHVETESDIPKVGDKVHIDDAPAPDGKYSFEPGVLVVKDGAITEVLPPEEDVTALAARVQALTAENKTLKEENEAVKKEVTEIGKTVAKLGELSSNWTPKPEKTGFRKPAGQGEPAVNAVAEARKNREERNKKK